MESETAGRTPGTTPDADPREHTSGAGDLRRALDLLWGHTPPPARGPKRGLTLAAVTEAAVAIADAEGLGAVSMRRVATELGVGTMSLYRYVPGKTELLELMLDHVQTPGPDAHQVRSDDWRTVMESVAWGTWRLYTGHSWLLRTNIARPLIGPGSLASFDLALAGLRGTGLDDRARMGVIVAVEALVTGSARTHVAARDAARRTGVSDEEFWAAQGPYLEAAMERGDYPHVAALDGEVFGISGEEYLARGLADLLDGVAARIAALPA